MDHEKITTNLVKNAWFQYKLDQWILNTGEVYFTESDGANWLCFNGENSCQVKQTVKLKMGHKYYLTVATHVTRSVQGKFGLILYGAFEEGSPVFIGSEGLTDGVRKYSTIVTANSATATYNLYIGSLLSANGDGKVGRASLIDLTELFGKGCEPDIESYEKLNLPHTSVGIRISKKDLLKIVMRSSMSKTAMNYSDKQLEAVFIEEMNRKAQQLGMADSTFINSHGLEVSGQVSTSRDMLKLSLHACGYSELLRVWGAKQYTIHIKGNKERKIQIKTTVSHPELESAYTILGGKTGTLITGGDAYNLACILACEEQLMIGVTMGASGENAKNKRFLAMKQLADFALKKAKNPSIKFEDNYFSHSGSILMYPKGSPLMYTHSPLPSFYSIKEDDLIRPASLTKILTALVLLETVKDLKETFVIIREDIVGGSGPKLYPGDRITFEDALYLMFLPSSNNTAKAIARVIGRKLIENRNCVI